jgi:TRAP-type C4-dicarboxylate transport system substrate-binding protein
MRFRVFAVALIWLLAVAGGCGAQPTGDKTGVTTKVLRVVNFDAINPNGQSPAAGVFLKELVALSGGQLKVNVVAHYENGSPTAETDEIRAVASGEFDLSWPSTRAFDAAGIGTLRPLETPFLLTSVEAVSALVTSSTATDLLSTLREDGLIGLGLAVGPLRRPMATRRLVTVSDWHGVTFRSYNSAIQTATIEALGGTGTTASYNFPNLVSNGELDGVELDTAQYVVNGYGDLLPHVTRNVVLWPKIFVFVMNAETYDHLSPQQQEWVRQAAQKAVEASVAFPYDETTPAEHMCAEGVTFHDASAGDRAALQHAAQKVIDQIANDPVNGPVLRAVQAIAAEHSGVDIPTVPEGCLR